MNGKGLFDLENDVRGYLACFTERIVFEKGGELISVKELRKSLCVRLNGKYQSLIERGEKLYQIVEDIVKATLEDYGYRPMGNFGVYLIPPKPDLEKICSENDQIYGKV